MSPLPAFVSRLPWPLPAVLAWALAWLLFSVLGRLGLPLGLALAAGMLAGVAASLWGDTRWRRIFIAAGFPLSLLASGLATGLPAWAWLAPLALLALLYPLNAWRDAPLFPTPAGALAGLPAHAPLPEDAHVLDAGCGLGHGLRELRRAYPTAHLFGLEWSWPLRVAAGLLCPWAMVRRGDIWRADWTGYDMVYLFQRPESMPRAWQKAVQEMRPGSWLVSLEFPVPDVPPVASLQLEGDRRVWIYRPAPPQQPAA